MHTERSPRRMRLHTDLSHGNGTEEKRHVFTEDMKELTEA